MDMDNSTIILDTNPWQVDSIQDFICLKCPECDFCSKEEIGFQKHAIKCHPLSFVLFREEDEEIVIELKENYNCIVENDCNYDMLSINSKSFENSNTSCLEERSEEIFENEYQEMIIEVDQKIDDDKNENDNNIIDDYNYETLNKNSKLCENSNISCPEERSEDIFENECKKVNFEFSDINQKIVDDKNENDSKFIDDYNYDILNTKSKLSENSTRFQEESSKENFENGQMQVIMQGGLYGCPWIMKLENVDDKNPKKESFEVTKESNKQKEIKLKANGNYKTLTKKTKYKTCSVNTCPNKSSNSHKDFFHFPSLKFPERHNAWISACHKDKAWKPSISNSVICEDHFDSFDYLVSYGLEKKKHLKRNTVPHLNLDPSITVNHDSQLPPKKNSLADKTLKDKLES